MSSSYVPDDDCEFSEYCTTTDPCCSGYLYKSGQCVPSSDVPEDDNSEYADPPCMTEVSFGWKR